MVECFVFLRPLGLRLSYYMDSEGVSLDKALKSLELEPEEAAIAELEIVDRDDLDDYGVKGRDYILVKKMSQLERYGYELDDVLRELNLDIKKLKKLGVSVDTNDEEDDD